MRREKETFWNVANFPLNYRSIAEQKQKWKVGRTLFEAINDLRNVRIITQLSRRKISLFLFQITFLYRSLFPMLKHMNKSKNQYIGFTFHELGTAHCFQFFFIFVTRVLFQTCFMLLFITRESLILWKITLEINFVLDMYRQTVTNI